MCSPDLKFISLTAQKLPYSIRAQCFEPHLISQSHISWSTAQTFHEICKINNQTHIRFLLMNKTINASLCVTFNCIS